jgi:ribosomal protein S18 acetylase RimI-like enzyme
MRPEGKMAAMNRTIWLEPISAKNVSAFKAVRLAALAESPTAFGSTLAEEAMLTDAEWLARAERCDGERNVGYLAFDEATACGLARTATDGHDPTVRCLASLWVAPRQRRRGAGRLLVGEIIAWARWRGLRALRLDVTSDNLPAIRLYQSLGFAFTGRTEPHPRLAGLTEDEMLLPLP